MRGFGQGRLAKKKGRIALNTSLKLDRMRSILKARSELVGFDGVGGAGGHRAILYAVIHRHSQMVRYLIEAGIDSNKLVRIGGTDKEIFSWVIPLSYASLAGA